MKRILKITALCLALLFLALSFASCMDKTGKPLLTYEDKSVSVNLYKLYLSRIRATLASYGYEVSSESFWNTVVEMDGKTLEDHYLETVLSEAKESLAILCLFEKLQNEGKVAFTDAHKAEINDTIDELVEYDANGSKTAFNSILYDFGANIEVLKLAYEIEIKRELLIAYYYGSNGSQISSEVKEEYLNENYVAFKQILISNFYYEYETDKNGDDIYYTETGKISYDKENGLPNYDESGAPEYDTDRNIIYYLENGKIAYDKTAGKRKNKTDENGKIVVTDYTEKELEENEKLVEKIVEGLTDGDKDSFEANIYKYAERANSTPEELTGAYYIRSNETSSYEYINTIVDVLNEIDAGEIRVIKSNYGYHIVMKYELEERAYENEANSAYFGDFIGDLTSILLKTHTQKYVADIEIDKDLLEDVSMLDVGNNFYY